jgi:hypothetical protein
MINFYMMYNGSGLDKEEYALDIRALYEENNPTTELTKIEHIIKRDATASYLYAIRRGGRWLEGEDAIKTDPWTIVKYARIVIQSRWYTAESYIMKHPIYAYYYAKHIIKGPWYEAEPYIAKSVEMIYYYSVDCIRERWVEQEWKLSQDAALWERYKRFFKI